MRTGIYNDRVSYFQWVAIGGSVSTGIIFSLLKTSLGDSQAVWLVVILIFSVEEFQITLPPKYVFPT